VKELIPHIITLHIQVVLLCQFIGCIVVLVGFSVWVVLLCQCMGCSVLLC